MKSAWKQYQIVDINNEKTKCRDCGSHITNLSNFVYGGESLSEPKYRDELCKCRHCGMLFIMHYDLFDKEGHIYAKVFTGDINNLNYNWQDILSENQKHAISEHLKVCKKCQETLSEEILTDAWLSNFMEDLRKSAHSKHV
jgi:late competence protein required for DNA uptake (superfamily II DNA/RNA helicase)